MKRKLIELSALIVLLVAATVAATGQRGKHVAKSGSAQATNQNESAGPLPEVSSEPELVKTDNRGLIPFAIDEAFGALRPVDSRPAQTKVSVYTGAAGGTEAVYRAFAGAIAAENPKPPDRDQAFAWVKEFDCRVTGWQATIVKAEPTGNDWYVMVSVRPMLAKNRGGVRFTKDHRFETYHFADGKLRYLAGLEPEFRWTRIYEREPEE